MDKADNIPMKKLTNEDVRKCLASLVNYNLSLFTIQRF